jgi:hypothetical protein
MSVARGDHKATLLSHGRVLVTGGDLAKTKLTETYDPVRGTWQSAGSLTANHEFSTATRLPNGKVLVAGGDDGTVFEDGKAVELGP